MTVRRRASIRADTLSISVRPPNSDMLPAIYFLFSRNDCQLHGLFLEQGHTQRLAEYVAKFAGRMRRSRRRK